MTKDSWSVVLEDDFRENIRSGWSVVVLCIKDAERERSSWSGEWQIFCMMPDGSERQVLIVQKYAKPRIIRTTHGVTSFLMEQGITVLAVPMKRGETVEIRHDGQLVVGRDPS